MRLQRRRVFAHRYAYARVSVAREVAITSTRTVSTAAAYGVKFAADGSVVCLCGAVIPKDGPAIEPGDRVTVHQSRDLQLIGRRFLVVEVGRSVHAVQRRFLAQPDPEGV